MIRPRALDLFCSAGGASMGLHRAGFDVVGVDIEPQPHYPFEFRLGDAFEAEIGGYDLVWASPPCQGATAYKRRPGHVRPVDTAGAITRIRERLISAGVPYIIENVEGSRALLRSPVLLCGSMFGLEVRRHRLFECSFPVAQQACHHELQRGDFPQATNRANRRKTVEVGVYRIPLATQQRAMGIDWMGLKELSQAIPPAYAEYLGRATLQAMRGSRPVAIVWARPSVAVPGTPWCAVVARPLKPDGSPGTSVVTACRGRWEIDPFDELRWQPTADEQCKGCVRELSSGIPAELGHADTIGSGAPVAEWDEPDISMEPDDASDPTWDGELLRSARTRARRLHGG